MRLKLSEYKACICENLKMANVKSYDFVYSYFSDPEILVKAIRRYTEVSKIQKGEYTLFDLIK